MVLKKLFDFLPLIAIEKRLKHQFNSIQIQCSTVYHQDDRKMADLENIYIIAYVSKCRLNI